MMKAPGTDLSVSLAVDCNGCGRSWYRLQGVSILSDWCLIFALEYGTYIGYSSFYLHNTNDIIVFDNA